MAKTKKKIDEELVLKNLEGKDMDPANYFYPYTEDEKDAKGEVKKDGYKQGETAIPVKIFNPGCGYPVEREDLIEAFNNVFAPKDGFLFYKSPDKELYCVIVPIQQSTEIGIQHNSQPGDFQRHSISFITEGSVNVDTLTAKLKRAAGTLHYSIK